MPEKPHRKLSPADSRLGEPPRGDFEVIDPIRMLGDDHVRLRKLFAEWRKTGDRAVKTRRELAKRIFKELAIHSELEEEIFYPSAEAAADDEEGVEIVLSAQEEHRQARETIEELQQLDQTSPEFLGTFRQLIDDVERHVDLEERELFPRAAHDLGEQLAEIGLEMLDAREELTGAGERARNVMPGDGGGEPERDGDDEDEEDDDREDRPAVRWSARAR